MLGNRYTGSCPQYRPPAIDRPRTGGLFRCTVAFITARKISSAPSISSATVCRSPLIDAKANANFSNTVTDNVLPTTTQPYDIIIAIVHTETTGTKGYHPAVAYAINRNYKARQEWCQIEN